jgi:hypothetical protein
MANSRDFTGKDRKFTGTKGIVVAKGTTGQRVGSESGELRFNTTTELMEYYDGNQWKPIDAPPTITSISTSDSVGTNNILNADGSTLHTITINGSNFGIGLSVKFVGNTGTEYVAGNITRVSNSQITCKTTSLMGTTDDPYDVIVINTSGLQAESADAFSFNEPPVFTNASGQLGTVYNGQVISGITLNAGATDAEGNTITFTIVSGSLPGSGLSFSSSTGAITGTLGGTPSLGNYPIVVRASTTEGVVERQFSIQVVAVPFVAATGGSVVTSGDYKIHTFTGGDNFVVSSAGNPTGSDTVEYLVVAGGGGGGGGGGGAGGFRTNFPSPAVGGLPVSATTYPITVGGAGGAGGANSSVGGTGTSSVFSTITSAGGGGGGYPGGGANAGGSGGGQGKDSSRPAQAAGNSPPVSPPQGNPGGGVNPGGSVGGAGGGGAGASGQGGSGGEFAGSGGGGSATSITGSSLTYAGGGSGGTNSSQAQGGTPGGGGAGGNSGAPGQSAQIANRGGGGGGSGWSNNSAGTGATGVVVIRYKFQ